eukprot:3496007-Pleurochrysis_carterae.AAC.6
MAICGCLSALLCADVCPVCPETRNPNRPAAGGFTVALNQSSHTSCSYCICLYSGLRPCTRSGPF